MIAAAGYDNLVALGVSALALAYLLIVLIFPERF